MNGRIVAFALNAWHGPWMNRQQLLSRLAVDVPVVYSNGCWSVWDIREAPWRRAPFTGRFIESDGVHVDVPPRWLLRWPRFARWSGYCLDRQARRLRRFSASLGTGPLIGYAFHPKFAGQIEALRPDLLVYHEYDLLERTPGWTEASAASRRALIDRADLVVASSRVIEHSQREAGARDVLFLPNGADVDAFERAADDGAGLPDDLAGIPRPRIGYVGNINRKVDLPLAAELARTHGDWQFVFIGGIGNLDEPTKDALERLETLPNVHFLGGKDHRTLPAYVAGMDVNTMLYRTDDAVWTAGIYPLKLHEYLAAGRPVVSAAIPSVMDYADVVAVASDAADWNRRLAEAVGGRGVAAVAERRRTARANSWDIRTTVLRQHLEGLVSGRS